MKIISNKQYGSLVNSCEKTRNNNHTKSIYLESKYDTLKRVEKLTKENKYILYVGVVDDLDTIIYIYKHRSISKINIDVVAESRILNRFQQMQRLSVKMCFYEKEERNCYIVDFVGKSGCGYGSLVMQKFLNYIRQFNIDSIIGHISSVDYDHIDLLHHFYQKFGFTIDGDNIRLDLEK